MGSVHAAAPFHTNITLILKQGVPSVERRVGVDWKHYIYRLPISQKSNFPK